MNLYEKLVNIQGRLKAPKNQRNNFGKYNYRSCEDILEAVKPLLLEHKLVLTITDNIENSGGWGDEPGLTFVNATASITDGKDTVEVKAQAGVDPNRKGMDIAQSFGSSSSYARKYALNGLFLIDDTKDPDVTNTHEKKATLKAKTEEFEKVVNYLKNGGNIANVERKYHLTNTIKSQLTKI
jgi:hypothetical protein